MDEVSRRVIIDEQKNNRNGMPWEDIHRFTDLVFELTTKELLNSSTLICDRSLLDLEAYLTVANKPTPNYLRDFPYKKTTTQQFFLHQLGLKYTVKMHKDYKNLTIV